MKSFIIVFTKLSLLVSLFIPSLAVASGWVCSYKNPDVLMTYQKTDNQWMLDNAKLESIENDTFLILQYKAADTNYGSVISTVINKKTLKSTYSQISFFKKFGEEAHSDKGECRFVK